LVEDKVTIDGYYFGSSVTKYVEELWGRSRDEKCGGVSKTSLCKTFRKNRYKYNPSIML
jgi:hypothetical protein